MVERVYKNIYMIYIPLPGNPLKWLNSYIIKADGSGRNLIIDTGFNRPECYSALMDGLKELGIDPADADVYLSHVHSDHTGNAAALQEMGSRVLMNQPDYHDIKTLDWSKRGRWFVTEGMPEDVCSNVLSNNPAILYAPRPFTADMIHDGDILEYGGFNLRCVHTPGHSVGHTCLYCEEEKVLFCGDHVLFDITPNICSMGTDTNMLGKYLESLKKIRELSIETALPAHRTVGCETIYERIDGLLAHHETRLAEAERITASKAGQTAYEIAGQMSWSIRTKNWDEFPPGQKWFAMGEALAHLDFLRAEGRVLREENGNGIFVYRCI